MNDNVVQFPQAENPDLSVDEVFELAKTKKLQQVIVIGVDDNETNHIVMSSLHLPDMLWLVKLAEMMIMEQADAYRV